MPVGSVWSEEDISRTSKNEQIIECYERVDMYIHIGCFIVLCMKSANK